MDLWSIDEQILALIGATVSAACVLPLLVKWWPRADGARSQARRGASGTGRGPRTLHHAVRQPRTATPLRARRPVARPSGARVGRQLAGAAQTA